MSHVQTIPTNVLEVFQGFAPDQRQTLLEVRELIFEVALEDHRICQIEEALRWGEPAYIRTKARTGSTIRLGVEKTSGQPALFFNCKTSLVEEFRLKFGGLFRYSKNRAILLDSPLDTSRSALKICISAALTYHIRD